MPRLRHADRVGGVTPGKGGTVKEGFPLFNTVAEAVRKTGANATMIFVPPPGAADAIMEAADAGIAVIVAITEGIPVLDMARAMRFLEGQAGRPARRPQLPRRHHARASARSASCPATSTSPARSASSAARGTLTYEAVWQLSNLGLGQSTCVGIGGDPIIGTTSVDVLKLFQDDPQTEAILMMGEIGGTAEEKAAEFVEATSPSRWPRSSPARRPRPASAWATPAPSSPAAAARRKTRSRPCEQAGILVADSPADLGTTVQKAMAKKR